MSVNPNPSRVTDASWWFMEEMVALQPGTKNGGIYAVKPGYHNTRAGNKPTNYSVADFSADRRGPADKAAGYDWTFTDAQSGRYANIMVYSQRLLRSGQDRNDPRLDGWREFYGQADTDTLVEGWDFQKYQPSSSDPSHLWHIHLSELREFVGDFENKRKMLSVLKGETYAQYLESLVPPAERGPIIMSENIELPARYAYDAKGNLIDRSAIRKVCGEWTGGGWLNTDKASATIFTHWTIDPPGDNDPVGLVKEALIIPEITYVDSGGKQQWVRQPVISLSHFHETDWVHLSGGQFGVSFGLMDNGYTFEVPVLFNLSYSSR